MIIVFGGTIAVTMLAFPTSDLKPVIKIMMVAAIRKTSTPTEEIDRIVTHQVGVAHKRLLFETLELDHARDFTTVETLGNMGSVSLPATLARAVQEGFINPGHRVVLQGIGSGLHCLMLAVEW